MSRLKSESGITLVALAITIAVMVILAGISINSIVGENGLVTEAKKIQSNIEQAEKEGQALINNMKSEEYKNDGVIIQNDEKAPRINDLTVEYKTENSIKINVNITETESGLAKIEYSMDNGENYVTPVNPKQKYHIFENIEYGEEEFIVKVKVIDEKGNASYASKNIPKFVLNTSYGRIDVVWLDKENNVIDKPLAPVLNGMTPVKWNGTQEVTTNSNDSNWYKYSSIEGLSDNTTSNWANAINSDGSYFVWIPRYAYRITYYANETSTEPTGYCDGRGIVKANGKYADGKDYKTSIYKLDDGIQTITYNNKSYIVHPAFMNDISSTFSHGGWSEELSGIWVAKYEMSQEKSTDSGRTWTAVTTSSSNDNILTTNEGNTRYRVVSKPDVSSWRYITIGNSYTNSLKYDESKKSHLMKNSEWGAVAYLIVSQYGRNGHEIDINNSSSFITGNGGGSTNAEPASGTTNAYNTSTGQKASSTGNIYGIYDLSGGAWEHVAIFNDTDTNNNESQIGSSFANPTSPSTPYATKYSNPSTQYTGQKIYDTGKIGDATKEVYNGVSNWYEDISDFLHAGYPFSGRGGYQENRSGAGIMCSYGNGGGIGESSFRVVLPGI